MNQKPSERINQIITQSERSEEYKLTTLAYTDAIYETE